jgi:hypothetical protein
MIRACIYRNGQRIRIHRCSIFCTARSRTVACANQTRERSRMRRGWMRADAGNQSRHKGPCLSLSNATLKATMTTRMQQHVPDMLRWQRLGACEYKGDKRRLHRSLLILGCSRQKMSACRIGVAPCLTGPSSPIRTCRGTRITLRPGTGHEQDRTFIWHTCQILNAEMPKCDKARLPVPG